MKNDEVNYDQIIDVAFRHIEASEFDAAMKYFEAIDMDCRNNYRLYEGFLRAKTENYTVPVRDKEFLLLNMYGVRSQAPQEEYERIRADYFDYIDRMKEILIGEEIQREKDTSDKILELVSKAENDFNERSNKALSFPPSIHKEIYKSNTQYLEAIKTESTMSIVIGLFGTFACIGVGSKLENNFWYGAAAAIALAAIFVLFKNWGIKPAVIDEIDREKKLMDEESEKRDQLFDEIMAKIVNEEAKFTGKYRKLAETINPKSVDEERRVKHFISSRMVFDSEYFIDMEMAERDRTVDRYSGDYLMEEFEQQKRAAINETYNVA